MSDRWLRWFQPTRRDPKRDVDEEIQFHLDARIADLVSRGASLDDARRQALSEFGDADAVRADTVRIDERIIRRERRADWFLRSHCDWSDGRTSASVRYPCAECSRR